MANDMDSSDVPLSTYPSNPNLDSSSNLRFPIPAASKTISNWIDKIPAGKMARSETPSEENILGDSTYEFIDTDTESRDDAATESVASTDYEQGDIASLADTEQSGEDSEDEDSPQVTSVTAHAVEQAFNTPTLGLSSVALMEDHDRPLIQSIEFEEPSTPLGGDTVSVKHTVMDFNEEETSCTAEHMQLPNPPKRMTATIRQTMSKQGLSTREPLHILFVGNHSAREDIIRKIASSVTASVNNGARDQYTRQSSSQLYNVVPVSAFGSERTPEIELMHSSGYQIKVENCTSAEGQQAEDSPEKPEHIKLILEDNFSYYSIPDGEDFIVEPPWDLPHVALFYCSENDDAEARRTMSAARKFMSRHGVPSIVISHKQLFNKGSCMSLDRHSPHMCLESRDLNGRGNIIHRRLPIDLASFLNIDARQMNRNLAHLTGLAEPVDTPVASEKPEVSTLNSRDIEKSSSAITDSVNFIRNRTGAEWRALLPVGFLLLSVLTAVLTGIPSYRFSSNSAMSVNSKVMSAVPISTSLSTMSLSVAKVTSTVTVTSSTVTCKATQSSGPNSLAVVPVTELGKLFQTGAKTPVNKTYICTAEILGDREILIRIPSGTKLSWLTKEALSVNITRNNLTVETERAYSSNDGIVLLLAKDQAYGLLNISIVTSKKPRVNETFQVDFGITVSRSWQNLVDKFSSLYETPLVSHMTYEQMRNAVDKLLVDARVQSQSTLAQVQDARRIAFEHAKTLSEQAAKQSASLSKNIGARLTEAEAKLADSMQSMEMLRFREPLDNGLWKAQVRSKLLWLKLQGKDAEYAEYERRATQAARVRAAEAKKAHKSAKKESRLKDRLRARRVERDERGAERKAAKAGGRMRV